jgi:hypothetical protein
MTPTLTPTATSAFIKINFIQPGINAFAGDSVHIIVTVSSVYELKSVQAQVESHTADLVYSSLDSCYGNLCCPCWAGDLSLADLSRGGKVLTVIATDDYSNSAQMTRTIILDRPPIVTVALPINLTVARPEIQLTASCTDDDPAGCTSLKVITFDSCPLLGIIASGISSIDQTVSLAVCDGQIVYLGFEGTDSAGQLTHVPREILVESSTHLSEVESVSSQIWDVQPDRILFLDPSNILKIYDRSSGQETSVPAIHGKTPKYGYLTPNGTIFMAQGSDLRSEGIYDWRDGTLLYLGVPNSTQSLKVSGNYAIWNGGDTGSPYLGKVLYLRDLIAGTTTTVSENALNWNNNVASNGDVVYASRDFQIFRYRGGISAQLTNDTSLRNIYPTTDGINVVYLKEDFGNNTYEIVMYGTEGETILAPAQSQQPLPEIDYQVDNGWIAYRKPGTGGQSQVWTRSSSGVESQVSFFSTSSRIDSIAPSGEVTFINGGRRYLAQPASIPIDINSWLGYSFWQDGHWYVVIGRSLFQVI